ncbi:MAG TPA: hypothetical protein VFG69_08410, partial [Nannocystaceae bacterium]|nr:hypothetical protein [Nannocystaceae bacterium]
QAAWDEQGLSAALPHFTRALETDGGALRRLQLALPANVDGPDSGAGALAVDLFERSPRFTAEDGAFTIAVSGSAAELQACLRSPTGTWMFCVTAPPAPEPEAGSEPIPDDDRQVAARLAQAFHDRAFAMPMQLSNVDLGSLDGTTAVATEAAREKSHALLEGLGQ